MSKPRFTKLLSQLPAIVPFVGPETQERARGSVFDARLGANECVFGASPKAIAAMQTGLEVLMVERDEDSLAKSHKYLRKVFDRDVEKGRLTIDKKEAIMKLYNGSTDYTTLSAVDIVIEAVVEDMEIKKSVFKTLDKAVPKGVVLASNISYLNIDEIAEVTERPQNVIGLHFFSPANLMKLLEIVIPKATSEFKNLNFKMIL